ncbi:MAG: guanine permease [Chlamydiae bacterium CG10_big_fil_rev_8_21_14_0_10_42_34]|nr:MAG: guanine permease [Chlamydiae bacterium CG10_big_fil_rev_8_21_14_0_10_42_34]
MKEIIAGISTFFTVAYLILLYPKILSDGGVDFGSALTATILTIVISTIFLGLYANFPALLAPGLSVGPFLVYSVIQKQQATWEIALGIVFWSGLVIFFLSIFKVRQKILLHLPISIKAASIGGIGLFLITVGLKELNILNEPIFNTPNAIVLFGLILFFTLHHFKITTAFLITILSCWIISIPFGYVSYNGIAALPSPVTPTFMKLDLLSSLEFKWFGTLLSVTLICLFDTSASLTALSKLAHKFDKSGKIKDIDRIVIPDGPGSMLGALLGTGTLAFTLESSSGIKAGGRTGICAIVAATCCMIGLFFYPLISSIPYFATVPVLIAIGLFMLTEIKQIRWRDYTESIPAMLTLITIPLTFSIYRGFAFGFVSYALLKGLKGQWKDVHPVCWALAIIFAAHLSWALATKHF